MTVEWPNRRQDVMEALKFFASDDPDARDAWPDLTNAVHWLIDDTWWDFHDPADYIGEMLTSTAEAEAVTAVIQPLLTILDEMAPSAPDADYFSHPRWDQVRTAATACLRLFELSD